MTVVQIDVSALQAKYKQDLVTGVMLTSHNTTCYSDVNKLNKEDRLFKTAACYAHLRHCQV